jgi:hypothetical protein
VLEPARLGRDVVSIDAKLLDRHDAGTEGTGDAAAVGRGTVIAPDMANALARHDVPVFRLG